MNKFKVCGYIISYGFYISTYSYCVIKKINITQNRI